LLIEEKRWEELDKYFGEMARVLSTDREPISNWEHFTNALIKAGDFDRYLRFLNMLDKGDDASRERQRSSLRSISSGEEIKTPDTRPQIWMMNQLLVHRLIDGSVPSKIVEEVWPRYISNCKSGYYVLPETINGAAHKLDEKETMAACYLGLIESVEYQVKYPLK
jgi:hypothetical protein